METGETGSWARGPEKPRRRRRKDVVGVKPLTVRQCVRRQRLPVEQISGMFKHQSLARRTAHHDSELLRTQMRQVQNRRQLSGDDLNQFRRVKEPRTTTTCDVSKKSVKSRCSIRRRDQNIGRGKTDRCRAVAGHGNFAQKRLVGVERIEIRIEIDADVGQTGVRLRPLIVKLQQCSSSCG